MKSISELITCMVLATAVSTFASGDQQQATSGVISAVTTEQAAKSLAVKFTGFSLRSESSSDSTLQTNGSRPAIAGSASTSLLATDSGTVWRVTMSGVEVPWTGLPPERWKRYSREYDILIDSASGHLVRVESRSIAFPVDSADQRFAPRGGWVYPELNRYFKGYPDTVYLPLADVLSNSPHGPYEAEIIVASYVLEAESDSVQPRPLWVIHLLGIPPVQFFGPGADDEPSAANSQTEIIYDILTGRLGSVTPHRRF